MPFSRENVKFTVLTAGFVMLVITAVAGIVAISYSQNPNSTPLYTAVVSFVTIQAGQLLLMLRTEQAHAEITKTRHDLSDKMQPIVSNTEAAAVAAVQAKEKLEEKETNGAFTPHEERLIAEIVRRSCAKPPT
jgi:hypothetical protein